MIYHTGNLGRYLGDGAINLFGWIDQQVKLLGVRIELGEVESVLAEHAGVKQCAVSMLEERSGEKRLVAFVVARDGEDVSSVELRAHLQRKLPDYMAPAAFVELRELPLTASRGSQPISQLPTRRSRRKHA